MIGLTENIGTGPTVIEWIDAAVRRVYDGTDERDIAVVAAELSISASRFLDLLCAFSIERAEMKRAIAGGAA